MKNLVFSNRYVQQYKDVCKYPDFDEELLKKYTTMLCNGEKLPAKTQNHKLSKNSRREFQGCWDFHLASDIAVIYKFDKNEVTLVSIGNHGKLKLTSSYDSKQNKKLKLRFRQM